MTIDTSKLTDLRQQYRESDTRSNRARIEREVLEAVLGTSVKAADTPSGFAVYSREELDVIQEAVDDDHEDAKSLLRRPYLKGL